MKSFFVQTKKENRINVMPENKIERAILEDFAKKQAATKELNAESLPVFTFSVPTED